MELNKRELDRYITKSDEDLIEGNDDKVITLCRTLLHSASYLSNVDRGLFVRRAGDGLVFLPGDAGALKKALRAVLDERGEKYEDFWEEVWEAK